MLAILTRVICGAIVLIGLTGRYLPRGGMAPDPVGTRHIVDTLHAASVPRAVVEPERPLEYDPEPIRRVYRVTAYCDRGLTAVGVPSGLGQCAAPAGIPFGSRIYVPALGRTFIVTDRTARRFRHDTVDLFIPDRADCKRFGCRRLACEITVPTDRVRYGSPRLRALLAAAH
jgi:3D (Asp-Asp-Asp) domain-containing protein